MIETPTTLGASCASHQAINHIVVDHQHRGISPLSSTLFLLQRYNRQPSLPMFRELVRPIFWELQKHFKKKILGWVEFFRRLTLIAGPFPSGPQPDVSSYKSKYDDIDWIVDNLAQPLLPCNLLSQFLLEMFWTNSWAALSWVCRCRGLPSLAAVDKPVPNLLDSPER